ncbi:M15 family metallopeptidase [Thomasclavelia saccharogumia]|uniref:M15 family metallopeptidase n=1 Tax=Thomasclavelia saccharogumia TaxID=341225 RepID=UPI00047C501E|nr:M15 family metallopeptidase [Thomasclavelia saccharogumia]
MKRRINKKRVAFIAAVFTIIISIIIYLIINIIFLISTPNTPTVQKAKKVSKKDPFTSLNYYLPSQKKRYENYKTKYPDLSDEEVVTYVNMNLDYNFYDHIIIQSNPSALNTLVNKYYRLDNNFSPSDLVYINDGYTSTNDPAYKYRKHQMSSVVYNDFVALRNKCRERGISFYVVSGYRSTLAQEKSYNHMVNTFSVDEADKTCSRPGHSEHTLGLACDVALDNYSFETIVNHPDYQWFAEIISDYGFIIRYPEGKDSLTGYSYEPWHLRYLGKDLAKKVTKSKLTYDEYYARNFMS